MARRLYLGKLPPDARSDDVQKFFDGYGRIVDCRVMTGFGFVEFESSRDAEDAMQHFNGKAFMGANIVVEFAKETRPRRDPYDADRAARSRRPPGYRLIVSGISRDTSWQDLKDFGREAGSVSYADIERDAPGEGILEYLSREDAERAVKELDGRDLRGQPVRVAMDREARNLVVNLVAMIVVMIVMLGMIATPEMTVTAMTATTGKTAATAGNALGRLLVGLKSMIVAPPGLHLPGGMLMIEGLQGTMTDEVAMMTEEPLILTMTAAGTMSTDAGTIAVGTRGTIATMTGLRGKADGRAEFGHWFSGIILIRCGPRNGFPNGVVDFPLSRFASNRFCCMEGVVYLELEGYPAIV
ncbi:hypothetical protein L226DRAFT_566877 [Lentinus tigrinus ALCF2SS1-7]|uniref:RRM domain-containing protein n=1 Tax=Lentinus tigrinus ALCF2SS1-6 TaxID=1328759 RepID=A0A5C2SSN3_9APHY|nr:hypothetical protein L227DRAFT_597622 [Lentinus tigrinus ALCF2SS1-6]RPD80377.1 hypothetical protein L226DRAFT_566877 [Lentinus tigrinus ALCF2SS1-7]